MVKFFQLNKYFPLSKLKKQTFLKILSILTGRKHPQIKLQCLQKYEYGKMGRRYIKSTLRLD